MMEMQRTITYDADQAKGFGREAMSRPGREQLEGCLQGGTRCCGGLANSLIRGRG